MCLSLVGWFSKSLQTMDVSNVCKTLFYSEVRYNSLVSVCIGLKRRLHPKGGMRAQMLASNSLLSGKLRGPPAHAIAAYMTIISSSTSQSSTSSLSTAFLLLCCSTFCCKPEQAASWYSNSCCEYITSYCSCQSLCRTATWFSTCPSLCPR